MLRIEAAPHLRPVPTGTAGVLISSAAHAAAGAGSGGRVEASPTHHPLSGMYTLPAESSGWLNLLPPDERRASRLLNAINPEERRAYEENPEYRALVDADRAKWAKKEDSARKDGSKDMDPKWSAYYMSLYRNMPFRGALREAAKRA